jgi:plastocyanin
MWNLRKEICPITSGIPRLLFALIVWWTLNPGPSGFAYEEISNFTGGHLRGTISIKGTLVSPKRFNLVLYADPYYCGRISDGKGWRFSPITRPGVNRSLPGAIIYLEDVQRGKPAPSTPRVVQTKNCVFLPYVSTAKSGEDLHFQNWDPVQHKLEIFLTSRTGGLRLFGQELPPHPDNSKSDFLSEGATGTHRAGPEVAYTVDKTGIVVFRCSYHEYMEGWSIVLPHPYVTMAGEKGEFSITNIPPGTYNLAAWHPMGHTTTTIRILPEQTLSLAVDIPSMSATIDPEAHPGANPYGIDLVGDAHITPTVELQTWDVPSEAGK